MSLMLIWFNFCILFLIILLIISFTTQTQIQFRNLTAFPVFKQFFLYFSVLKKYEYLQYQRNNFDILLGKVIKYRFFLRNCFQQFCSLSVFPQINSMKALILTIYVLSIVSIINARSNRNMIVGNWNNLRGSSNRVIGHMNKIHGEDNVNFGFESNIKGTGNRIVGVRKNINGNNIKMFGVDAHPKYSNQPTIQLSKWEKLKTKSPINNRKQANDSHFSSFSEEFKRKYNI